MTDLIIHIGLPKTGTSTIQSNLLAELPQFLGKEKKNRCLSGTSWEAQELIRLVEGTIWEPESVVKRRVKEWSAHCESIMSQAFPNEEEKPEALVLSEEKLATWPLAPNSGTRWPIITGWNTHVKSSRIRPAPIVRFIQKFGSILWPYGDIRVLLTLRNQSDWLASHYSQLSSRIPNASQHDFEERIKTLMHTEDPFLNWFAWLEDLEQVLGTDNVQALIMEDMCTSSFWTCLVKFLNIDDVFPEYYASSQMQRKNVRRDITSGIWEIRDIKIKKTIMQSGFFSNYFPGRKIFMKSVRKTEGFLIRPILRLTLDRARGRSIQMEDRIRGLIKEKMNLSNMSLAEKLGRDLKTMGY